jgi:hypothetical protein
MAMSPSWSAAIQRANTVIWATCKAALTAVDIEVHRTADNAALFIV